MTKMTERKCSREDCGSLIHEEEIKEDTSLFWTCPKCNRKTYKYSFSGYLALGERSRKYKISSKTVDFRGNKSIMQKEKDSWTHEVIDDEDKVIHKKHKE